MIDAPPASLPDVLERLGPVMDVEGKLRRALVDLGMPAACDATVLDVPGTGWVARLCGEDGAAADGAAADGAATDGAAGERPAPGERTADGPLLVPSDAPLRVPAPDGSQSAVVAMWTGFRGIDEAELAEVDRVLRPGGRLLVVHDYGRDDVSALRAPDAPEYVLWSRREGPFLRGAGFKIRVVHCFWTFASVDEARERLASLGDRGEAVAASIRRPRLSWNVAVYHRTKPVPGSAPG